MMNIESSVDNLNGEGLCNLIAFRLDRHTFGLPIEPIVQIIEMVTITPVPQVNYAVQGVINVRGALVPVINMRRHLGLPEASLQLHTPVILVQIDGRTVGLIVDEVVDVLSLPVHQITRPADILPEGLDDVPLLHGLMMQAPDGMKLLTGLDRLFLPEQTRALIQAIDALSAEGILKEAGEAEPHCSDVGNQGPKADKIAAETGA